MAEKNYYDILGVKKDATDAEIKKKYRKLVRQYHPDVSDDPDADNKIAEINNAYETIRDKDKRAEYDAMLNNPFAGQGGAGGFGGQSASGGQGGFRWEDIKDQFGEGQAYGDGGFRFDDIFSAFGGGGARGQSQQGGFRSQNSQGQDQHAEITVDLSSVYSGDDYSIKLNVPVRQPNGSVDYENKTLKIKIPKGITDGKQIRLAGQGAAGIGGGKNGDLFLKVKIRHADNIRIEGADVYQTVNVAPWEAALGEKINVSTPAGTLGVTIPKNSKSGSNLRLRGKTPNQQIIMAFNPISKHHWLYDFCEVNPPSSFIFTHSTYKDNPFLNAEYVAELEELYTRNPQKARVFCDGEWGVNSDGLVFKNWKVREFDHAEIDGQLMCGLDFGFVNDISALVASLMDEKNKRIYIFKEYGATGKTNKDLVDIITALGFNKSVIIADAAEPKSSIF